MANIPKIVVLCGSTRFTQAFRTANCRETLAGHIVLSVGCDDVRAGETYGRRAKTELDELHLRKIDLADEVLVLNVEGYIGDSTMAEIVYAVQKGKPIRFFERGVLPPTPKVDVDGDLESSRRFPR